LLDKVLALQQPCEYRIERVHAAESGADSKGWVSFPWPWVSAFVGLVGECIPFPSFHIRF